VCRGKGTVCSFPGQGLALSIKRVFESINPRGRALAEKCFVMQPALTRTPKDFSVSHATCPSCGQALQFARTVRGTDGLVDLQTFACRECSLGVTEAAEEHKPL
jgi:hypothetical protein